MDFLRKNKAMGLHRYWCTDYPKIAKCHCMKNHNVMRIGDIPMPVRSKVKVVEGHFKVGLVCG